MVELPFSDVEGLTDALGEHAYLADRGLCHRDLPVAVAGQAAAARGRGRRRQDRGGQGAVDAARPRPDPAAVLRGHRRVAGPVRVELLAAADRGARDGRVATADAHVEDLFGAEFLVERPLLAAIKAGSRAVLLVDELDRADDEFEAFLLEILSEFAVTIPEVGRIARRDAAGRDRHVEPHARVARRAEAPVPVPLDRSPESGSRGRDRARPRARTWSEALARDVASAVERLRELDLAKVPGVAETIDWANALQFLGAERLDVAVAADTLGRGREGPRGPGAGHRAAGRGGRGGWLAARSRRWSRSGATCATAACRSAPAGS